MTWRRAATALTAVVAVLAAAGCTPQTRWVKPTAGGAASGTPNVSSPSWHDCANVAAGVMSRPPSNVKFDCATIEVPADWAHPENGKTFDLALIRARASGQSGRIGSLIVNPGGPGASGIDLAVYLSGELPTEITRRFDIVGFDPRGVGRSTNVKCIPDADLDTMFGYVPDPVSQTDFNTFVTLNQKIADECATKYGDQLSLFSTEQAARDIDAIRQAVGDQKTTYLGYSYGTLLGATYSELFPKNLRSVVLDGAVDPTQTFVQASEGQAMGFERAFNDFAAWCKNNPSQCGIAPDARAAVTTALNKALTSPVSSGGRKATAGWVMTGVTSSLYSQDTWPTLSLAISSLNSGDARRIFALADAYAERDPSGRYSNLFDANIAVNCTDDGHSPTVAQVRDLQSQWRAKYPLFGATLAVGLLSCAVWKGKRDPYPTGAAAGAPPIVVVGTTGDPATPYEQTAKLAQMLGVGRVLTWQGEGHTAYPQTRCIVNAVDQYLLNQQPPAQGTTCPAR